MKSMHYLENKYFFDFGKKICSFTLVEVIVSSLISAFIFGTISWILITYSVKGRNGFQELQLNNEIRLLNKRIQRDIDATDFIYSQESNLVFVSKRRKSKGVYSIESEFVRRVDDSYIDNFHVRVDSVSFVQLEGYGLITGLSIYVRYGKSELIISGLKNYSSEQLIEWDRD